MDYGLYARSRLRLWGWLIVPVVLIVSLHLCFCVYYQHTTRRLKGRNRAVELLPEMTARLGMARGRIRPFSQISGDRSDALDTLSEDVSALAKEHGFAVDSLQVSDKGGAGGGTGVSYVQAAIKGRGRLPAIVKFLNELNVPERLMVAESVSLGTSDFGREPDYAASLVLRFGFLSKRD